MQFNQHGLARTIPEPVKRTVRQRCKFGCVICRLAFFQYDHFDPEFKDATQHRPEGICCLCSTCHQEVTSGRYSREFVEKRVKQIAESDAQPTSPPLDLHDCTECLTFGGLKYNLIPINLIEVYGETLLAIHPRNGSEPGSITGKFFSDTGNEALSIIRNEIIFNSKNWDIEVVGRSIKVRSAPRQICLEMELNPPQSLVVKKIDMCFRDVHVFANQHTFCVGKRMSEWNYFWVGTEVKVLENRFRGVAIRVDDPLVLGNEWNSVDRITIRRPILRSENNQNYLEFKTSGFPNIGGGFFSTAFLGNRDMAIDSYSGIIHFNLGISIANRVGSFWIGSTFSANASLNDVRKKFRGEGPKSTNELAKRFV